MKPSLCLLCLLLLLCGVAGCGNVYLRGEAATAVETSAMDSYLVAQKAGADGTCPTWVKGYLEENFRQWRSFARSNRAEPTWGPRLASENTTTSAVPGSK